METSTPTLEQALFWMNIYRDLLAVDESALERMRALITDSTNGDRVDARGRGSRVALAPSALHRHSLEWPHSTH